MMNRLHFARSMALNVTVLLMIARCPASAYEYPSVEHGVKPERAFFFGDIDQVRLFNGGLSVSIPIGQRFRVGPELEYGFTLTYDSQIWDYVGAVSGSSTVTQAWPVRGANAGFGWRLSLGEFSDQNTVGPGTCSNCYIAADGARHQFNDILHPGVNDDGVTDYANDSTYLRLRTVGGVHEIDFPNGVVHKFRVDGRLERMSDPFGNWVQVDYGPFLWTVTDSVGRTQTVELTTVDNYGTAVSKVKLRGFNNSDATYTFTYVNAFVPRSCLDDDPQTSSSIKVPFLTQVKLPPTSSGENATFSMPLSSYNFSSFGICNPGSTAPQEGLLLNVTLPTLGRVEWSYASYQFPTPFKEEGQPPPWLQMTAGVTTRTLRDATGAVLGTWSYLQQQLEGGQDAVETITRVVTPLLDYTDHYFRVGHDLGPLYGLPFSDSESAPGRSDLKRSSKVYDCAANGTSCVLERTTYLKYAVDSLFAGAPEFNPRVEASYTRFDDDNSFAAVDYSDFDGLGNFRRSQTSGSFGAGNIRNEYVDYNPGSGVYPGSFSMPTTTHWVLNAYRDFSWESENGSTAVRTFDVDPETGLMKRARTHRTAITTMPTVGQPPGGETDTDLIAVTTYDARGFLEHESYYGGDRQTVATTTPLRDLALPGTSVYRIDHETFYGTLATSTYFDTSTAEAMTFRALDCGDDLDTPAFDPGIDQWTGLPGKCRDSARITTTFDYDELGRVKWIKPQSGHDAWTQFEYVAATTPQALALVNVYRRPNDNESGTPWAESNLQLDALGRVWKEQRKMADSSFSTRETLYDGMGHIRSVSQEGNANKKTSYVGYDAFGRPNQIVYPDGHDSTFLYSGEREVQRSVLVRDSLTDEHRAWTIEVRDRQGRLYQLKEPAEADSTNTVTTYFYDVGNRLARSRQLTDSDGTQNRFFTYDQRGFLLKEQHPEKGASPNGNGIVFYGDYDARGHAWRRYECALASCGVNERKAHLTFVYDAAERLKSVTDANANKLLKEFIYGTSNADGVRTNGRLLTAKRYNYHNVPPNDFTIRVDETYSHGGKGGRVSNRTTQLYSSTIANPTPAAGEGFAQSWTYDELGSPKTIVQPQCTTGSCLNHDSARTITDNYTNGWLTSITGTGNASYASAITYHPNGMLKKLSRSNGVSFSVGLDKDYMLRPQSFSTSSTSADWSSGTYRYDGAGNIRSIGQSTFTYDQVSRVKTAELLVEGMPGLPFADGFESGDLHCWAPSSCLSGGETVTQSYTYDPFGNLKNIAGTPGRVTPTSAATNRLNEAEYDVAGNLLSWHNDTYEYDALGMVTRRCPSGCAANALDFRYTYTADDERFWSLQVTQGQSGSNVWTLRDLDGRTLREYDAPAIWAARDYIYRGTELLASNFPGEGDRHFHVDHLGTPRLVTNSAGAKVAYHVYLPFGEEATSTAQDAERRKFTGHERDTLGTSDSSDDRDYMHARHYNPLVGRFLGVDPTIVSGAAVGPQLWNRYSYTAGNPENRTDPTGRNWFAIPQGMTADKGTTWEWHEGDSYTRSGHTYKSKFTHLLLAKAVGTSATGATRFTLVLYNQNKVALTGIAFSGGDGHSPLPSGEYTIRADLKDEHGPDRINAASPLKNPPPFYGMQVIRDEPLLDSSSGDYYDVRSAYGPLRAYLNPFDSTIPGATGNYLHGQAASGPGSTHGCLCYGQDARIINEIWKLATPVAVSVQGGGPSP